MKCHKISCPKYFMLHNGTCQLMFQKTKDIIFRVCLKIIPSSEQPCTGDTVSKVIESLKDFFDQRGFFMSDVKMFCIFDQNVNTSMLVPQYFHLILDIEAYNNKMRSIIDDILGHLQSLCSNYLTRGNLSTSPIQNESFEFKLCEVENVNAINISQSASSTNMVVEIDVYSNIQRPLSYFFRERNNSDVILNIASLINCPHVVIPQSELSLTRLANESVVIDREFVLTDNSYYLYSNSIYICANIFQNYLLERHKGRYVDIPMPEVIVSLVCSSISIFALVLTLLSYLMLVKLRRNVPGKNIIMLSTTLILAQCSYIVANFAGLEKGSIWCKVWGIFVHFSWLWAVIWMNVCTYHMFRTLISTRPMCADSGFRKVFVYMLYSICSSSFVVGINIVVSYQVFGQLGYGENSCYVSSQTMIYFTFALPVAFFVSSNIIMFLTIVFKLKRTSNITKNVKNERSDIAVFAKLSTLTGVTWLFGFIYLWTSLKVFSYLFLVLNGSQGLFIFVAFVVNKRVFVMYRDLSSSLGLSTTNAGSSSL